MARRFFALAFILAGLIFLMFGCASQAPSCSPAGSANSTNSAYSPAFWANTNTNANCSVNSTSNLSNVSNSSQAPIHAPVPIVNNSPSPNLNNSPSLILNNSASPVANSSPSPAALNSSNLSVQQNSTLAGNSQAAGNITPVGNITLKVVYFYSSSCPFCRDTEAFINQTASDFSKWGVSLEKHNILSTQAEFALYTDFADRYNVSQNLRVIPMVFINSTYIYTNGSIKENLAREIDACVQSGTCADPYAFKA